ncbi:hypothetical protein H2200_003750 [Cladophialophora chaetospira]|uniref:Uncharacterized protein n=1 Tax=Cladophialophora chaetospira TaxID=386627 RepID=A0AA39CLE2_9EURO|nr:hypothetical protein H2200_003750 [Cladophialophora chaetospira]
MAPASRSAIPVFIFLGLVLVFVPIAALAIVCIQRRQQRLRSEQSRAETADRVAENLYRWSKAEPIELDTLQPPPSVAIKPIRGMSADKRPQLYTRSTLGQEDPPYERPRPLTEFAAHTPPRTIEKDLPELPAPPLSPRCNLQAALESEASPSSVRAGNEKKAYLTDAPRVKSQKVHPEQATEAFHSAERPPLPETESVYFVLEQQHYPAR